MVWRPLDELEDHEPPERVWADKLWRANEEILSRLVAETRKVDDPEQIRILIWLANAQIETRMHEENRLLGEKQLWREKEGPYQRAARRRFYPRRGRRRGSAKEELVAELERRVAMDEKPTTAARAILRERGYNGGLKGAADALVKLWRAKQRF